MLYAHASCNLYAGVPRVGPVPRAIIVGRACYVWITFFAKWVSKRWFSGEHRTVPDHASKWAPIRVDQHARVAGRVFAFVSRGPCFVLARVRAPLLCSLVLGTDRISTLILFVVLLRCVQCAGPFV